MTFNFNTPMTFYEFLALCLSVLALILPLIKTIYKTWIQQPKLKFLPAGRTYLYFNQSGSDRWCIRGECKTSIRKKYRNKNRSSER